MHDTTDHDIAKDNERDDEQKSDDESDGKR